MNGGNDDGPGEGGPGSRRGMIAAVLVLAVLVLGTLWITRTLRTTGQVQDCVMAGRANCAPVR